MMTPPPPVTPLHQQLIDAGGDFDWQHPDLTAIGGHRPLDDLPARLEQRLEHPTSGPPLAEHLSGPVLLVVPDATRATGVPAMYRAIMAHLDAAGVPSAERRLLIAGGTHRVASSHEIDALFPAPRPPHVEGHDARDADQLRACGHTLRGTPVLLNRRLFETGTTILIGGITGHYFAGFTGGLKGIVPGAAGFETALANHRLVVDLDSASGLHPTCREGNLTGNPVHADLTEAARLAPRPFLVNVVVGAEGKPVDVVTGDPEPAHLRGVEVARTAATPALEPADLVLVGAADAGRERDWIQGHKLVRQGAAWVRDGGLLIARVTCHDGVGSDSLPGWLDLPEQELAGRVARDYSLHGHTALAMRALFRRVRVILISDLPDATVLRMGMQPARSVAAAIKGAAAQLDRRARAVLLDRAGALLPPRGGPVGPAD